MKTHDRIVIDLTTATLTDGLRAVLADALAHAIKEHGVTTAKVHEVKFRPAPAPGDGEEIWLRLPTQALPPVAFGEVGDVVRQDRPYVVPGTDDNEAYGGYPIPVEGLRRMQEIGVCVQLRAVAPSSEVDHFSPRHDGSLEKAELCASQHGFAVDTDGMTVLTACRPMHKAGVWLCIRMPKESSL